MTANPNALILSLICVSAALTGLHAQPSDSLQAAAAVQHASGAQVQQSPAEQQQSPSAQRALNSSSPSPAASSLQAHLNGIQAQAQRQISQLNGLMLSGVNQLAPLAVQAANLTNSSKYGNVLEVLSNVGRAIHQQIVNGGNSGGNQIQIVTAPNSPSRELLAGNNKKNEYQSTAVGENQKLSLESSKQSAPPSVGANNSVSSGAGYNLVNNGPNSTAAQNYREQSEQLRQDISRRAGQLQQVVASSMEVLKNNGDLIVRRLLEQLNGRLDQAKAKADKIINEPAVNEVAIKALTTINQGLNNLNNIITNIVSRLDINAKDANANLAAVAASASSPASLSGEQSQPRGGPNSPLDPSRFKLNFHQLGQQFSSAINAVQQQQRQMQLQQKHQQQQNANMASNNLKLAQAAN